MLPFLNVTVIQRIRSPNDRKDWSTFFFYTYLLRVLRFSSHLGGQIYFLIKIHHTSCLCSIFIFWSNRKANHKFHLQRNTEYIEPRVSLLWFHSTLTKMIPKVSMEQKWWKWSFWPVWKQDRPQNTNVASIIVLITKELKP